jgi:hypothetical protein
VVVAPSVAVVVVNAAVVVVGGRLGRVTSAGFSPLMAGVGGPSSLQALNAPAAMSRPAASAKARRRGREGVWWAERTTCEYHFGGG